MTSMIALDLDKTLLRMKTILNHYLIDTCNKIIQYIIHGLLSCWNVILFLPKASFGRKIIFSEKKYTHSNFCKTSDSINY